MWSRSREARTGPAGAGIWTRHLGDSHSAATLEPGQWSLGQPSLPPRSRELSISHQLVIGLDPLFPWVQGLGIF